MNPIFDPFTGQPIQYDSSGQPIKPKVEPNTRRMMYHPTLPCRVVANAEEAERMKAAGWTNERGHGEHPHSKDPDRVQMQQVRASMGGRGSREAKEALIAKGLLQAEEAPKEQKNGKKAEEAPKE